MDKNMDLQTLYPAASKEDTPPKENAPAKEDAPAKEAGLLRPKELSNVIENIMQDNVVLSPASKRVMAQVYVRFRHNIMSVLKTDFSSSPQLILVIGDVMAFLRTCSVEGIEKKQILLEVIRIVIRFEIPAERKDACLAFVDTVICPAIDLAVYYQQQNKLGKKCLCF